MKNIFAARRKRHQEMIRRLDALLRRGGKGAGQDMGTDDETEGNNKAPTTPDDPEQQVDNGTEKIMADGKARGYYFACEVYALLGIGPRELTSLRRRKIIRYEKVSVTKAHYNPDDVHALMRKPGDTAGDADLGAGN